MNQKISLLLASILSTTTVLAATPVDLKHQSAKDIQHYFAVKSGAKSNPYQLIKVSADTDVNQTTHVRLQELYAGIPVWKATSVLHLPKANNGKSTVHGLFYEDLENDLVATSSTALSTLQKQKAMQEAKLAFEKKTGRVNLSYSQESLKTIIYVDDQNTAHYAFLVSFYSDDGKTGAHRPTSIINAESLQSYHSWDAVMTENPDSFAWVLAGGIGGNEKIGEVIYDGAADHRPPANAATVSYEYEHNGDKINFTLCMLMNEDIVIFDMSYGNAATGLCALSEEHNRVYWLSNESNGTRWEEDAINGGYSPSLDAYYNASIVNQFYREWYDVPPLVQEDGKTAMPLMMRVHYGRNFDNAFWDGQQMTFGDGGTYFYPLTSLDVTAHEISHGFTQQHSNIMAYEPQMGALHEAFSDEAAVAVQYYANGKTTWSIGGDITKSDEALRYLDDPKKDGHSIDNLNDFDEADPHYGAGIFNKAFYLIATSDGWDIRKAFNIMVKANMDYWTSSMTTLSEAACGVSSATKDYGYNLADVQMAFEKVGIDISAC